MTCIVLTQNPQRGGVLAITEGEDGDEIAQWPNVDAAKAAIENHTLIKAWGGYVIDLDNLDILPI
jgi:hypothetical protein